jgi:hypothetical protein
MIFGAFTEEELCSFQKSRNSFPTAAAVCRGGLFQPWQTGAMHVVGSRMPSGGRKGDTYTVYPGMEIKDDVANIKKLFKYAKVRSLGHCRSNLLRKSFVFRILKGCWLKWRLTLLRLLRACKQTQCIAML